jgi:type I restriction enzyme S subunit
MGDLKPGWKKWRFDEIATNVTDRVDDPSDAGVDHYIGLEHLDSDSLKIRRWGSPDDVSATKLLFEPGDVIFGRRRAYQRKLGVAEFRGIASAHSLVLRAKPEVVLPEFLPFFLQSDVFMERAQDISVGSLSPTVNWRTLAKQEFALPPLEEQKRLIRLLQQALGASEEPPLAELHHLVASVVMTTLAGTPNLGPEDVKPASWPLVDRTVALNEIVESDAPVCYGVVQRGTHIEQGVPALTISDLGTDYSAAYRVSPDIDESYSRSRIEPGDLIVAIKATIGPIDRVPEGFRGNIQRQLARIRLSATSPISKEFLYWIWQSPAYQRYLRSMTVGSTRAELSISTLKELQIPVISRAKQEELVETLEALSNQHAQLQQRWATSKKLYATIVNSALGAFESIP